MKVETSAYSDANTLCNKLDTIMLELTKKCSNRCCEYSEDHKDIYTTMYKLNEAFRHVVEARSLLHRIGV